MSKIIGIILVLIASIAVGVADALTKKSAFNIGSFSTAIKNPLMLVVITLYLFQIGIFLYVFVKGLDLGVVGILQNVFYAVVVIVSGVLFFNEKITLIQGVGMGIAMIGVILINSF